MIDKRPILIANDHAGFELKRSIITQKYKSKIFFEDLGSNSSDSVDYPDFAHSLCKKINSNDNKIGILICGSGIGMSIVANRYENVRAALCLNIEMVSLCRKHNNANILVLGSRLISCTEAIKCIETFIFTKFEEGRHQTRLDKFNNVNI